MKKDSIGSRMKENYEFRAKVKLTRRTPVIIRLDGKSFSTLTRDCEQPFSSAFSLAIDKTAKYLVDNIQGAKLAYCQSDEISLLLTDFDTFTTDAWFDYNKSKLESVSAGMASAYFSYLWNSLVVFDSRAFNIPKEEVCNYFIWRQLDWIRNSINMLAESMYSCKELYDKNGSERQDMMHSKGVNWVNLQDKWKNGTVIVNKDTRYDVVFTKDRSIVEDILIQPDPAIIDSFDLTKEE